MKVQVKLYATLRDYAPRKCGIGEAFLFEVKDNTVRAILEKLSIPEEYARIVMVNGSRISDYSYKLDENDLVVIFPPIGGG
ncbi:MAG: MoaD/ThiS family protein [Candidatus Lokiarchaeota archaeon]|nr:MoaD/ThiS family protein [Candidatus Lokiarchaeota archaeon]